MLLCKLLCSTSFCLPAIVRPTSAQLRQRDSRVGFSELLGIYQILIPAGSFFCLYPVHFSKMLNSSLKSGLVSMSVPDHQVIQYHIERCVENGFIALPLPESDVEATFVIADPSV
jgi:hypothetical protein